MTTDLIRDRLVRDGSLTVASGATRFTRDQLKNPAEAVQTIHRSLSGGGTGKGDSGSLTDMTSFFRRDPELPSGIRERLTRGGEVADATSGRSGRGTGSGSSPTGVISRDGATGGNRGSIDRGGVVDRGTAGGGIDRGGRGQGTPSNGGIVRGDGSGSRSDGAGSRGGAVDRGDWRNRVERPRDNDSGSATTPRTRGDDWRDRTPRRDGDTINRGTEGGVTVPRTQPSGSDDSWRRPARGSEPVDETPRRVIDRITGDSGSRSASPRPGAVERPRSTERPAAVDRPRSGGSDRSSGAVERPRTAAPAPRPESRDRSSSDDSSRSSESGSRGTNIRRD